MGLLRLTLSKYSRRLRRPVAAICATRNDSEPKALAVLASAYTPSPAMAAPTMMTLATPIITPSSVRKLRSLCERMESIASQNAFWNCCQERENPCAGLGHLY
jgi:hypothetical protein